MTITRITGRTATSHPTLSPAPRLERLWPASLLLLLAAGAFPGCGEVEPGSSGPAQRHGSGERSVSDGPIQEVDDSNLWVQRYQQRRQPELLRQLEEFQLQVQRAPNDAKALRELGWLEYQLGRTPDALDHLAQSVRFDRRDGEASYRLGVVQLGEQHLEDADKSFRQALKLAPQHALALQQLGVTCLRRQRLAEAEEFLSQAAGVNALDAESRVLLARLRSESDLVAAISLLEEAVGIDRYHRGAYDLLRRLYRRTGRIEEAKRATKTVEELALLDDLGVLGHPLQPERFLAEADYYRRHERFERSLEVLHEGIRVHPSEADLHLLEGRIHAHEQRWQDASESLSEALRLAPDSVVPFEELSEWITQSETPSAIPEAWVDRLREAAKRWPELSSRLPIDR